LAIYRGLRKGELFGLEWRDVGLSKDRGMITVRDTKNHETRYVPMNKKVGQAIESHSKRIVDDFLSPHLV
jgi:site-specific recombinase XerD|tara:strand:- start:31 stop:240 length:210 start_codon:yes stop_codon:yes gene_type:complete